jgi:hypothetical protein
MSADPETTRILRSWLDEGVTELPERVLDAVLDRVPATPQHRATWWPVRRTPTMNKILGFGLAAAAVLVVAFLGIRLLGGGTNIGGPASSPSDEPTPTALPTPEPTPGPTPVVDVDFTTHPGEGSALRPGSYVIDFAPPAEVTFTVPDTPFEGLPSAWYKAAYDWGPWHQSQSAVLSVVDVVNLYTDPCDPDLGLRDPAVGPTVDDLVAALSSASWLEVTATSDATISGYSGQLVEYTGIEGMSECADLTNVWEVTGGGDSMQIPGAGDSQRLWILDVEGQRLVIGASEGPGFTDQEGLQSIVDSLVIEVP